MGRVTNENRAKRPPTRRERIDSVRRRMTANGPSGEGSSVYLILDVSIVSKVFTRELLTSTLNAHTFCSWDRMFEYLKSEAMFWKEEEYPGNYFRER